MGGTISTRQYVLLNIHTVLQRYVFEHPVLMITVGLDT
jgi:hypothetical protein